MRQRELELLVDIAKLLKKYGPDPFELLAKVISTPEMTQHLIELLEQSAKTAKTVKKTKKITKKKHKISIPKLLLEIKESEPEKFEILTNLYNDLILKNFLPSLREIKQLAIEYGLPEINFKSRQQAINQIIDSLINLTLEEIKAKIQLIEKYSGNDRSLEDWSKIILNTQQKKDE